MPGSKKTVDEMKKKREVSPQLRESLKEYNRIRKIIISELGSEPKTIPEIARSSGLEENTVTYHLMTMMKYGEIEEDRMDDMDEYYYYRLGSD
ncbi:MAG: hypothetical protein GF417_02240 [Candidatus Latescibacteria bacterium]|nr:hypothetical protein [bacterium]MBD3423249.1 hypothetical protein [Candidatus Latescibacterota bacterium]